MTYLALRQIRQNIYHEQRQCFKDNGEDMDDYRKYPYSAVKARFYIETAAILVSILQHTRVQPNHLTVLYALLGPISVVLVYSGNETAYMLALCNFVFLKGILDWSDGALARITGKCTSLGAILDPWGAFVNSYSFHVCLGLYVFNVTNDSNFVLLVIVIVFFRAIDLRRFKYSSLGMDLSEGVIEKGQEENEESEFGDDLGRGARFVVPYIVTTQILDDRARVVDLLALVILIELIVGGVYVTNLVVYLMAIGVIVKFTAGFYVVYSNKSVAQLRKTLAGHSV